MTEVLAPAGSPECFEAAVRAGADAVYFGAGDFNARRNAKNFTEEDVRQCAAFARVRGVKTYLTLNTLIADVELSAALRTAESAAKAGVDALIVQDLGLIKLLRRHLPEMPLHASTQMSVHSPEALYPLKEMGFERVVVAREMDKSSLSALCAEAKSLGLEIEAFVHGALCMCLSGQCYLSSVLGGRSGNRGLCAQPCRLPFEVAGGTGHDLSLRDMSLISKIGEMTDLGVTSFKIEGRMKRPEYVAAAVAAVRAAVDGKADSQEINGLLYGLFSRSGHTDGYFTGSIGRPMFGVRTDSDERLSVETVNKAHELYRREYQRVGLSADFRLKSGEPFELTVSDGDGHKVTVKGDVPQTALTRETAADFVRSKLSKSGGTPYIFQSINCDIDGGLSVSAASVSEARRSALFKMDDLRSCYNGEKAQNSTVSEFSLTRKVGDGGALKTVVYFRNAQQIPEQLDGVSAVILPSECDFSKIVLPAGITLIADIPRGVLHNSAKTVNDLIKAKQNGAKAAVCGNLAAFRFAESAGLTSIAGFGMNIYNSHSVEAVAEMGAKAAVLSFEMSLSDAVRTAGSIPKGIISYGRLPLMLFRNCPGRNGAGCASCNGRCELTDRKGVTFPVMCRGEFSELFNSRPVWLFDRQNEMRGLDFQVIMFTDETHDRCAEVLRAVTEKSAPDVDFTRGLYYREVF